MNLCLDLITDQLHRWLKEISDRPFIVGLSGPQGCGKTMLTSKLSKDVTFISVSLDDFYFGHDDLLAISNQNPDNPFLQFRGCPGTHDLSLLHGVLQDLVSGKMTRIPQYDKSAFNGRGDRCPLNRWKLINFKPQIVILEGWCLGFRSTNAAINDPHLSIINENLKQFEFLNSYFNAFIHIVAQDINYVYDWRIEQEESLRRSKGDPNAGLSNQELVDFIDRFMPVYAIGVDGLREAGLSNPGRHLEIIIDHDRQIKSQKLI